MSYNGVIETVTGDLLRCGFCDFQDDGSFDAATESYKTDIPFPGKVRGDDEEPMMHRWTGSAWTEVAQP